MKPVYPPINCALKYLLIKLNEIESSGWFKIIPVKSVWGFLPMP